MSRGHNNILMYGGITVISEIQSGIVYHGTIRKGTELGKNYDEALSNREIERIVHNLVNKPYLA